MKKRYSEEQIIGFLRDGEAGIAVKDLVDVVPSPLGGARTKATATLDSRRGFVCAFDVTEEFPFLVTKFATCYDRLNQNRRCENEYAWIYRGARSPTTPTCG